MANGNRYCEFFILAFIMVVFSLLEFFFGGFPKTNIRAKVLRGIESYVASFISGEVSYHLICVVS